MTGPFRHGVAGVEQGVSVKLKVDFRVNIRRGPGGGVEDVATTDLTYPHTYLPRLALNIPTQT